METQEYVFDVKLWATARVTASSESEAREKLSNYTDCLDIGMVTLDGVTFNEASSEGEPDLNEIIYDTEAARQNAAPDPDACHCGNCDWTGSSRDCNAIQDVEERLCDGGGIMLAPAGECPECGALAHYDKDKAAWQAAQAAPELLRALAAVAARIDVNSGTASWTADEHIALAEIVERAGG